MLQDKNCRWYIAFLHQMIHVFDFFVETTVMSFSKNFVTPAGDLPQKKIVHVHASPHHLQQDILTALSTAENDGSFKSLVIPVRSNGK